jgi:hypothetical protein
MCRPRLIYLMPDLDQLRIVSRIAPSLASEGGRGGWEGRRSQISGDDAEKHGIRWQNPPFSWSRPSCDAIGPTVL